MASITLTTTAAALARSIAEGLADDGHVYVLTVFRAPRAVENYRNLDGESVWAELEPEHWVAEVGCWKEPQASLVIQEALDILGAKVVVDRFAQAANGHLVVDAVGGQFRVTHET